MMVRMTENEETAERGVRMGRPARAGLLAAMVFLVAMNLRPAIVAVGPLLESLGRDLGWGESAQGLLAALPLLAFAAMSPLVRFITARIGEDAAVLLALVFIAAGALLRSAGGSAVVWVGTLVVGCAIAVGNVLVPAIVKRDYAGHVSVATGVYSGCITAGSAIASLTAASMAAHWGGWRAALAFWAVPALVVAVLWGCRIAAKRRMARGDEGVGDGAETIASPAVSSAETIQSGEPSREGNDVAPARAGRGASQAELGDMSVPDSAPTPLWRRPMTWWVTAFMGLQSAAFYTMSNWLPSVASSIGFDEGSAGRQLFVFQVIGVFSGLLIPRLMNVRGNQIVAALVASLPMVVAGLGWIIVPSLSMLWAVIGGCGQGAALVVALALIAMRGRTQTETVALSGIAQSLGYLLASIGPSLFGVLAEHTGGFLAPLVFFTALAAMQCAVAFRVGRDA